MGVLLGRNSSIPCGDVEKSVSDSGIRLIHGDDGSAVLHVDDEFAVGFFFQLIDPGDEDILGKRLGGAEIDLHVEFGGSVGPGRSIQKGCERQCASELFESHKRLRYW